MIFLIHRQNDGPQFYWTLVQDANHHVLATSELYHNKRDVENIIQTIIEELTGNASVVYKVDDRT